MRYLFLFLSISFWTISSLEQAPKDTSWKKIYRETPARINNLVHTKLDLKPDFSQ